jgi:hypothetical protein
MYNLRNSLLSPQLVGTVVIASMLITRPTHMTAQPAFTDWSAADNLGAIVNSASNESGPALSKNGLSLYFNSDRPGGLGGNDIWVSQRNSVEEPWGAPIGLGLVVNSTADDVFPNLSRDGHWLFFVSRRPGGFGGFDIWFSYRDHTHDDFDWQPPVNAGPTINSTAFDQNPFYFDNEDLGVPQLFFARTLASGNHILVSNLLPDGTFGPATLVAELNSTGNDRGVSVRFDGLEVFLMSTRPGGLGAQDLWRATRETVFDPWSTPTNLGALVNSAAGDVDPHLASDRETLYFVSSRPGGSGGQDLYATTRTKQKP